MLKPVQTNSVSRLRSALAVAIVVPLLAIVAGCAGPVPTGAQRAADDSNSRIAQVLRTADATRAGGDVAAAAALYQRAYAMAPERPEPLLALAEAASLLGRQEEAAQAYRKALALAPDNASAHRGYGKTLIALNRSEMVAEQFRAAIRLAPTITPLTTALESRLTSPRITNRRSKAIFKGWPRRPTTCRCATTSRCR